MAHGAGRRRKGVGTSERVLLRREWVRAWCGRFWHRWGRWRTRRFCLGRHGTGLRLGVCFGGGRRSGRGARRWRHPVGDVAAAAVRRAPELCRTGKGARLLRALCLGRGGGAGRLVRQGRRARRRRGFVRIQGSGRRRTIRRTRNHGGDHRHPRRVAESALCRLRVICRAGTRRWTAWGASRHRVRGRVSRRRRRGPTLGLRKLLPLQLLVPSELLACAGRLGRTIAHGARLVPLDAGVRISQGPSRDVSLPATPGAAAPVLHA